MPRLHVSLLGKFQIQLGVKTLGGCESQKAQELFCYLLLHRHGPHTREKLATIFWENQSTAQAKKYLRQALWQLQSTLDQLGQPANLLLNIDADWIQAIFDDDVWLDTAVLEQAYTAVQDIPGREMDDAQVRFLQSATALYQGELLEGWYQEWCLFERERLRNLYLILLDKLVDYCQYHSEHYEMGIRVGMQILRHDYAHERTHRRLMRLYFLTGNRTAALRQYQQCVQALREELGVEPGQRTIELYQFICADQPLPSLMVAADPSTTTTSLTPLLGRLNALQTSLDLIRQQVADNIHAVESALQSAGTAR